MTTKPPVTQARIDIAEKFGIHNAATAALACRQAGLPFYAACALLQKESSGRNVYGHDKDGVRPAEVVTAANFLDFLVRVMNGATSNGVGPCQITYAGSLRNGHRDGGYFRQMAEQGLRPWVVHDNMVFGFSILAGHRARTSSWVTAGRLYNGSEQYGIDLAAKVSQWYRRMHP